MLLQLIEIAHNRGEIGKHRVKSTVLKKAVKTHAQRPKDMTQRPQRQNKTKDITKESCLQDITKNSIKPPSLMH